MKKIVSMLMSAALIANFSAVMAESETTTFFSEDFSGTRNDVIAKGIQGRAVSAWQLYEDTDLGSQAVYIQKTVAGRGFLRTPTADYETPVSGNIRLSAKFKVNSTANLEYYPLTFKSDKQIKTNDDVYDFAKTVYISKGKFMIANPDAPSDITTSNGIYTTTEIADVQTDKWYDLTIELKIDGDETTFDSWSYSLKDISGTVIGSGADYVLGVSEGNGTYNFFDMAGIKRFIFGYVGNTSADDDSIIYMDDVVIEEFAEKPDESEDPTVKTYFSEKFSGTKTDLTDRIQARAVSTWDVTNEADWDSQVVFVQKNANGAGFLRIPTADYDTPVSGNIEMKAKFKVNNLTDVEYYPLSFKTDKQLKTDDSFYDFAKMIYISKGKFMIANPDAPSDIASTNGIYTTTEIADVQTDKWYDLTINLYIDGDETTFDSWSYSLKDTAGNVIGSGENYVLGVSQGNSAYNFFDMAGIKRFIASYINNSTAVNSIMYLDDVSIKAQLAAPKISNVDIDTTEAQRPVITVTFNQEMNVDSFSGITVKDEQGNAVELEISSDNASVCTVKILTDLPYETNFTLTVPSTVTAASGAAMEELTKSFTAPKFQIPTEETYLSEEFSGVKTDLLDRIQARAVSAWNVVNDTDLDSGVVYVQKNVKGTGFLRTPTADYETPVSGNIEMKAKFKVNNLTDVEYYPLSFKSDKQIKTNDDVFDFAKMIYISKGKFMIANPDAPADITTSAGVYTTAEVADAETDKWYDLTIRLNIDGDETTFDTWSYTLKDIAGNEIGSGENYVLGVSQGNAAYNFFDMAGIKRFLASYINNSTAVDSIMYLDDVSIVKLKNPVATASISDGAENVSVSDEIVISFSQPVDAEGFDRITLTKGGENVAVSVRPTTGYTKTCTVTFADNLDYNREYVLNIPQMQYEYKVYSDALNIRFKTELKKNAIEVENLTINDGGAVVVAAGEKIKINADFANVSSADEDAALIVAVYDKYGTMHGAVYKNTTVETGKSASLEAELTVPQDVGEDAYIMVYTWNGIGIMSPISGAIKRP